MTTTDLLRHDRLTTPRRPAQLAAAAAMILAPVLLLAGTAVMPSALGTRSGPDQAKAFRLLADAAPDRSRIPLAVILVGVGLGLLIVAAVALAALSGASKIAVVGAALVAIGAPIGAAVNAVSGMTIYRLTDSDLPRKSAARILAWSSGGAGATMFALYLLVLLGVVLLAVALWRSHALPWWNTGLIGVGAVIGFAAPEGPIGAAATLPLLAGMTLAARTMTAAPSRGRRSSGRTTGVVAP